MAKTNWFWAVLVLAGIATALALAWKRDSVTPAVAGGAAATGAEQTPGGAARASGVNGETTAPDATRPDASAGATADAPAGTTGSVTTAALPQPTWPVAPKAAATDSAAASTEAPVAVELAFQALARVGIDAAAEKTWRRAIDDPKTPAGTRSDLIEDLNQEGYIDNSHPTKADLPLILARLELIERLSPFAIDDVNRGAFAEAYKDLLEMYVRLGGAPRAAK